ncbi:MAG: hypothetical protein CMH57_03920 [Myxococcales bacterium]|nr:hypothetical protein [Myxococcales bacterium]
MARDPRKVSLYLPQTMLKEIEHEAHRQDRSMSWIVRQAWQLAKEHIRKMPGAHIMEPPPED